MTEGVAVVFEPTLGCALGRPQRETPASVRALVGSLTRRASLDASLRVRLSQVYRIDDVAELYRVVDEIVAEARAADLPHLIPMALIQQAVHMGRCAEYAAAEALLNQITPADEVQMPVDIRVRLHLNRGTLAAQRLDMNLARAELQVAAQLGRYHSLPQFTYFAMHNLGYGTALGGDLPLGLRQIDQADHLAASVDPGVVSRDRGYVLMEAGLLSEAHEVLTEARDRLLAAQRLKEALFTELDLSWCDLFRGDNQAVMDRSPEVVEQCARIGARARVIEARTQMLHAQAWSGDPVVLLAEANELVAEIEATDGLTMGALLPVRVHLLLACGKVAEAATHAAALRVAARVPSLTERCLARRVQVELFLAVGRPDRAGFVVRAAAQDVSRVRSGSSSLNMRAGLSLHTYRLARADLVLARDSGRPSAMLNASERWRVARAPMPRVIKAAPLIDVWNKLRRLHERRADPGVDRSELGTEIAATQRILRDAALTQKAEPGATEVVRSDEVVQTAEERAATLVSFVPVGDELLSVLVRPGEQPRLITMPISYRAAGHLVRAARTDLEAMARVSVVGSGSVLRAGVERSARDSLADMRAALVEPLGELTDEVVVVPTQHWAAAPWRLTFGAAALTVTRSATHWVRMARVVQDPRVAAIAGPDLTLAPTEQAAVLQAWGQPAHDGTTSTTLQETLRGADLVHVAAHGHHERENPLFSYVLLGDGPFFIHELESSSPLGSSHVVLSACRAAVSGVRPGDEPLGLAASFLSFGVSTVVAPVSTVPDETAYLVMQAYHRALASGATAARALAEATADAGLVGGTFECFGSSWQAAVSADRRASP